MGGHVVWSSDYCENEPHVLLRKLKMSFRGPNITWRLPTNSRRKHHARSQELIRLTLANTYSTPPPPPPCRTCDMDFRHLRSSNTDKHSQLPTGLDKRSRPSFLLNLQDIFSLFLDHHTVALLFTRSHHHTSPANTYAHAQGYAVHTRQESYVFTNATQQDKMLGNKTNVIMWH